MTQGPTDLRGPRHRTDVSTQPLRDNTTITNALTMGATGVSTVGQPMARCNSRELWPAPTRAYLNTWWNCKPRSSQKP